MGWGGVGGVGGWLETDNRAISVQLDLTGTLTGTELGNKKELSKEQGFNTRKSYKVTFCVYSKKHFY